MQQLILIIHVLIAISVVSLVLLQHGRGADVGASFGSGAANTMFGSVGPASFLMKLTSILGIIFFVTSLGLVILTSHQQSSALGDLTSLSTTTSSPLSHVPMGEG